MSAESINNLEELIQKYTGPSKKLVKSTVQRLTAPGENYLGIVLKVDAVLKNEKGEEEDFNAVAKCLNFKLPEFMRKTVPAQYKKENAFYTEVVPTLEEFQREIGLEEQGINGIFPKLYSSRSSLVEGAEEPDEDAVLLFENLGVKGYANADRTQGFELNGAKLIIKDLAAFHAIPIALKLTKPEVFEQKIKKHLYKMFGGSGFEPPPPPPNEEKMEDIWLKVLEPYDEVKPYLETLEKKLKKSQESFMENMKRIPKEPFATITHHDLWTNNTMQVFNDGIPIKNKFVDFQMYDYGSAAQDVVFFLWSSLQLPVAEEHFDSLVKLYHDHFINLLDKCGCDTTPFNYENFLKEIDENAKIEFFHIMFMMIPLYGKKGEAAFDMQEGPPKMTQEKISTIARNRTAHLVAEFGKRGWL